LKTHPFCFFLSLLSSKSKKNVPAPAATMVDITTAQLDGISAFSATFNTAVNKTNIIKERFPLIPGNITPMNIA
jgi:hypothetical protein